MFLNTFYVKQVDIVNKHLNGRMNRGHAVIHTTWAVTSIKPE